jgi:glycosyltransferase involved in cell wall biosynthesis
MGDMSAGVRGAHPRVSIVVPAYNCAAFLPQTVESIKAQTFEDWQLVLFDDGSTDETYAVAGALAAADARIRLVRGPNGGVAAARNRAFEQTDAEAEFVAFLDNDDVWETDALATMVTAFDGHPEYVGVHGLARCIDDEGRPVPGDDLESFLRARRGFRAGRLVALAPDEPTSFGALVHHNWITTLGTALLRRPAVVEIGDFDPDTVPADDADFMIRLSRLGDFGFIDRSILQWRRHPEAQSVRSTKWRRAAFRVRAKTLTDPSNTPDQLRSMHRAYRQSIGELMRGAWSSSPRTSARSAYKAADLTQAYIRANVRLWARRARKSRPRSTT